MTQKTKVGIAINNTITKTKRLMKSILKYTFTLMMLFSLILVNFKFALAEEARPLEEDTSIITSAKNDKYSADVNNTLKENILKNDKYTKIKNILLQTKNMDYISINEIHFPVELKYGVIESLKINGELIYTPKEEGTDKFEYTILEENSKSEASVEINVKLTQILGCTDTSANNYNSEATEDNDTCTYSAIIPNSEARPLAEAPQKTTKTKDDLYNINTDDNKLNINILKNDEYNDIENIFLKIDGADYISLKEISFPVELKYGVIESLKINGELIYTPKEEGTDTFRYILEENGKDEATVKINVSLYYILGCTNPSANNYNSSATKDNGTCNFPGRGCTDPNATNYNSRITIDNGTCTYKTTTDTNTGGGSGGGSIPICNTRTLENGIVSSYPECEITCDENYTLVEDKCTLNDDIDTTLENIDEEVDNESITDEGEINDEEGSVLGEKTWSDQLLKCENNKIFAIQDNTKTYIPDLKTLAKKYFGKEVNYATCEDINNIPEVLGDNTKEECVSDRKIVDGDLIRGSSMEIFAIKNSKKFHIRSLEELAKNYFGKEIFNVCDSILELF